MSRSSALGRRSEDLLNATDPGVELRRAGLALRLRILDAHHRAGGGHLGSSLSLVELLTGLFRRHFRWGDDHENDLENDLEEVGDRFVLSKGHGALAYYSLLAELGRLEATALDEFSRNGSRLEPHPNETLLADVHASTGSLGQGLSIGIGLALGSRLRGDPCRTFVIIGDGECNEGQIWEGASCAPRLKLDNLVVLLDDNGMQQDGPTSEILPVGDIGRRWAALGWQTATCPGHDAEAIALRLGELLAVADGRPKLLHAQTVKGRGVDHLEGRVESHYPPPLSGSDLAMISYTLSRGAE